MLILQRDTVADVFVKQASLRWLWAWKQNPFSKRKVKPRQSDTIDSLVQILICSPVPLLHYSLLETLSCHSHQRRSAHRSRQPSASRRSHQPCRTKCEQQKRRTRDMCEICCCSAARDGRAMTCVLLAPHLHKTQTRQHLSEITHRLSQHAISAPLTLATPHPPPPITSPTTHHPQHITHSPPIPRQPTNPPPATYSSTPTTTSPFVL